jgi:hypothetical protein
VRYFLNYTDVLDTNLRPPSCDIILGDENKSHEAKSGVCGRCEPPPCVGNIVKFLQNFRLARTVDGPNVPVISEVALRLPTFTKRELSLC